MATRPKSRRPSKAAKKIVAHWKALPPKERAARVRALVRRKKPGPKPPPPLVIEGDPIAAVRHFLGFRPPPKA